MVKCSVRSFFRPEARHINKSYDRVGKEEKGESEGKREKRKKRGKNKGKQEAKIVNNTYLSFALGGKEFQLLKC